MGSLHSALVLITGVCVLIFVVAWIAGAVYFGVKRHAGPRDWVRALPRTVPRALSRRLLLAAGVYVFLTLVGHSEGFWRHLQ